MRLAFDLDDTLIPCVHAFAVEQRPRGLFSRWTSAEPVRLGAPELLRSLASDGHELWVYTASLRGPAAVKRLFRSHGVRIRRVINARIHQASVCRSAEHLKTCTKYPPAFGIDLLIDNCEGVVAESVRYGYPVLHLRPDDGDWVRTVLGAVAAAAGKAA
jgi:hypothetical protein